MFKKGLAYYNHRIRNSKFIKAFNEYFPPELLNSIRRMSNSNDWIIKLLRKSNTDKTYHPVRHLLLMTFLEMTAEEFFFNFKEFKPFGDGPYPCLNAASNHFGEFLIEKCQVQNNITKGEKNRGLPTGIFECTCGFIYQRVGPDRDKEDRFRFDSVREHGVIWENRLSEYWQNSNISIAKIAAELKTSLCKITRHAIRLSLPEQFPEVRQIQGYERYRNPRKSFADRQFYYRNEWLNVLKNNPAATRQELIDHNNFKYQWLRRNDSSWLERHLPYVLKVPRNNQTLDWSKIDREIYDKIERVIFQIRQETNPQKRVSITQIIERVGNKKWIDKRRSRLPLTTKLIDENLESLEDFMIRKINPTKDLYLKEKIVPTKLQFMIRAGLRNKTSSGSIQIISEIDSAIEFLKRNLL